MGANRQQADIGWASPTTLQDGRRRTAGRKQGREAQGVSSGREKKDKGNVRGAARSTPMD